LQQQERLCAYDLSNIDGNSVQIKLSSGFMFWDIDYSPLILPIVKNSKLKMFRLPIATDETGKNMLQKIAKRDGNILEQPLPECNYPEYKCKPQPTNTSRSYILPHIWIIYTAFMNFKNSPNIAFFKTNEASRCLPVI